MHTILADYTVSVTELKRNYAAIVAEADGAVAVLNHNKPESYLIPAARYEALMDYLEDLEDAETVRRRSNETGVEVALDDL
ncbi:type II toxin-antitoxin system Phd/YefM family antitoxin [Neisseria shayeganii]|uniref:Antitoxin n=2 Tax=Neisseria shayeganii TaxID=607712 RepID=G4CKR4_9NEIS|nr:type II toxin-antitoxin system Phd/YefM family antitoxin [Neisseria shayeganii]EGY51597.1 prevent-host-death family antitoxin [Neisseria shayeganii 871]QMT40629.1 type II toxin-antitoxin system Phd/YefM family antitoxin [Neisseria shayeganii]